MSDPHVLAEAPRQLREFYIARLYHQILQAEGEISDAIKAKVDGVFENTTKD